MLVRFADIEMGRGSGPQGPIGCSDFDPSYPEVRSSDNPLEARDGVLPGRDYFGSRRVSFDIWTNRRTMAEARETLGAVLEAWRDEKVRLEAGVLVPLDFRGSTDPSWRRVYGRPRRADDPSFGMRMRQGRAESTLEFEVFDPLVYEAEEESAEIRVVESGSISDSWVPPWEWPVVPGAGVSERRAGALQVSGKVATPPRIEFHGPGRRFSLDGSRGWHVGLRDSVELAYDEVITIDPRERTITDNFGRERSAALDRRSHPADIKLPPGLENVFFSADDPTHRARAVVLWRPAYSSFA